MRARTAVTVGASTRVELLGRLVDANLGDGDSMQRGVELAVAGATEAVAVMVG